ncbi:hypothetical protein ACFFLS_11865 [Flavobacterium procerum]|uniref:Uncharacterized protein n=1 Tax=Flavobacterium procerum TaxID=1455569 RepID=A0ABV6BQL1_9FLAO
MRKKILKIIIGLFILFSAYFTMRYFQLQKAEEKFSKIIVGTFKASNTNLIIDFLEYHQFRIQGRTDEKYYGDGNWHVNGNGELELSFENGESLFLQVKIKDSSLIGINENKSFYKIQTED